MAEANASGKEDASRKNRCIVVVGAGIAGLTAAYFLKKAGYHPIVMEGSERVGGRMATEVVNGFTIDYGAQFLADKFTVEPNLIDSLGLKREYIETSRYSGVVRKGKIRIFTTQNPLSPLRAGILSLFGWLRFAYRGNRLSAQMESIPPSEFAAYSKYDDEDAESWSARYFGEELTDYVVEPPNDGFYYQSLREISRVIPMYTTSMFFIKRAKCMTLSGGINILPQRLASELDVRLNAKVRSLLIDRTGIELNTDNEQVVADRVILATPAYVASGLYKEPSTIERELLATPYSPTLVIALAIKDTFEIAPEISRLYGVFIPRKEREVINAIANGDLGGKDKSRLANGRLLVAFLSGKAGSEMIDWKESDILDSVMNEMEKYFAGISGNLLFTKVYRWKEASAKSPLGRSRNVAQYRKTVCGSTKVFLAGDYMGLPCTEGAAESGKWAAEALVKNLT